MDEKALPAYAELMAEIKLRTEAIDVVLGRQVPLRAKIAEELCYLQLRMICETIAIGCLLVHGDISAKKSDLMKSYKADWIIKQLTELHPRFYPYPLEDKDDITRSKTRMTSTTEAGSSGRTAKATISASRNWFGSTIALRAIVYIAGPQGTSSRRIAPSTSSKFKVGETKLFVC